MPTKKSRAQRGPSPDLLRDIVLDSARDLPLHAQLRHSLERLIREKFDHDARFFSEAQLIGHFGISQGTIRRALADLTAQGLLDKRPARGTIVLKAPTARGLRNLAVFLPDYSSQFVAHFLSLINDECLNRGIALHPIYTHREEHLLRAYNNLRFISQEGAVLLLQNSPGATLELLSALRERGYDCVVIDTLLRQVECKYVGGSNADAIRTGMDHLVELGHRHIALLVNEPEEMENVQERVASFLTYVKNSSIRLEGELIRCGIALWSGSVDLVNAAILECVERKNRPTAIFAVSDFGALSAIKFLQSKGIDVPGEISILGMDGLEMGALVHPALTTLRTPFESLTEAAFQLLEPGTAAAKIVYPPTLLIRESTTSPRKS